jgi:hypothetical protein
MIFDHFVQTASDDDCQDGVVDEHSDQGLAQPGVGRGLGFARRIRAVLAEADAKPADDIVPGPGADRQQENATKHASEQPSAATSPALSHTRSHRKRVGGAYGDQTRTGYVNTFSSVRCGSNFCSESIDQIVSGAYQSLVLLTAADYYFILERYAALCLVPRATSWAGRLHGFLAVVGIQ